MVLVNAFWDTFMFSLEWVGIGQHLFCVLTGMRLGWSTNVEMHYVTSLALDGFGQHMLRNVLCRRWHGREFVNIC